MVDWPEKTLVYLGANRDQEIGLDQDRSTTSTQVSKHHPLESRSFCNLAAREGRTVQCRNASSNPLFNVDIDGAGLPLDAFAKEAEGAVESCFIPVRASETVLGVLVLHMKASSNTSSRQVGVEEQHEATTTLRQKQCTVPHLRGARMGVEWSSMQ